MLYGCKATKNLYSLYFLGMVFAEKQKKMIPTFTGKYHPSYFVSFCYPLIAYLTFDLTLVFFSLVGDVSKLR